MFQNVVNMVFEFDIIYLLSEMELLNQGKIDLKGKKLLSVAGVLSN